MFSGMSFFLSFFFQFGVGFHFYLEGRMCSLDRASDGCEAIEKDKPVELSLRMETLEQTLSKFAHSSWSPVGRL